MKFLSGAACAFHSGGPAAPSWLVRVPCLCSRFGLTLWAIELQEEVVVDNGVLTDKDKQPVRTKSADLTVHENGALTNTENIAIRTRSADYTVGSDGRMVNDEGALVQTRSADFMITEDGTMVQAEATSSRRLAEPATVKVDVKTPVHVKAPRHDIEVLDWTGLSQTGFSSGETGRRLEASDPGSESEEIEGDTPTFSFETTCEKATKALDEFNGNGMSSVLLHWRDLSDEGTEKGSEREPGVQSL